VRVTDRGPHAIGAAQGAFDPVSAGSGTERPHRHEQTTTQHRGSAVKLWKWHTLVFRCPKCGTETDYALQVTDGPDKGSSWDPAYFCERCHGTAHAREPWLFGAVYGPLMAMIAALAYDSLPRAFDLPLWPRVAFACMCCAVVGWPLSRFLSRHLVAWEMRAPSRRATRTERF
jgi:hypothetical protein